jgi:hypothetical protein
MRHALVLGLAVWSLAGFAAADTSDCAALSSHAESRACLSKKAYASSVALQDAEEELAKAITHWDEDPYWKSKSANALRTSNQDFYRYRESYCDFSASLAAGGNGAGDMRLECIMELNRQRLDMLRAQEEAFR